LGVRISKGKRTHQMIFSVKGWGGGEMVGRDGAKWCSSGLVFNNGRGNRGEALGVKLGRRREGELIKSIGDGEEDMFGRKKRRWRWGKGAMGARNLPNGKICQNQCIVVRKGQGSEKLTNLKGQQARATSTIHWRRGNLKGNEKTPVSQKGANQPPRGPGGGENEGERLGKNVKKKKLCERILMGQYWVN